MRRIVTGLFTLMLMLLWALPAVAATPQQVAYPSAFFYPEREGKVVLFDEKDRAEAVPLTWDSIYRPNWGYGTKGGDNKLVYYCPLLANAALAQTDIWKLALSDLVTDPDAVASYRVELFGLQSDRIEVTVVYMPVNDAAGTKAYFLRFERKRDEGEGKSNIDMEQVRYLMTLQDSTGAATAFYIDPMVETFYILAAPPANGTHHNFGSYGDGVWWSYESPFDIGEMPKYYGFPEGDSAQELYLTEKDGWTFTANTVAQRSIKLFGTTRDNYAVERRFPEATLSFFYGSESRFQKDGVLTIPAPAGSYLYRADYQGNLTAVAAPHDGYSGFTLTGVRSIGRYVVSDRQLDLTRPVPVPTGMRPVETA